MNGWQKIKVTTDGVITKVFIDDKEIAVRYLSLEQVVGQEVPILKLEIPTLNFEFEGATVLEIKNISGEE